MSARRFPLSAIRHAFRLRMREYAGCLHRASPALHRSTRRGSLKAAISDLVTWADAPIEIPEAVMTAAQLREKAKIVREYAEWKSDPGAWRRAVEEAERLFALAKNRDDVLKHARAA